MTFLWSKQRIKAAELVAEDKQTNDAIAAEVGLSVAGLEKWKRAPEFKTRVEAILEDNRQRLRDQGLANKQNRLDALNDANDRLTRVIEARAADPHLAKVPGGDQGIIVTHWKTITKPDGSTTSVPEHAVDTGMLKERRETAKQAAQEVGQWLEKRDITSDGKPLIDLDKALTVIHEYPESGAEGQP